jgi:protein tyrosine phosphatase (PTP) superfamily phosphohydrolase (DUF442 family)
MRVFFSDLWHLLLPHRVSRPGAKSASRSSWRLRAQTNAFARIPGVPEPPGPGHMSRSRDCFDSREDAGIREKTQMFHLQWFRTCGVHRGKPGLPGGHGRRLALLGFLIATSLLETGCQSDPCSPCGFSGFIGRTTSFITRPFRRDPGGCCGSQVVAEAGCVPSGVPVAAPVAPIVVPGATVVPGAATPSNVPPPDYPQNLEVAPQATPGQAPVRRLPSSTGNTGSTKSSSSYETFRPDTRSNSSRGDNLAHTLISTPVPAARSAQESSRVVTRDTSSPLDGDDKGNSESVLDHLPPLDLPSDVTEKTTTPPVQRKPQSPAPAPASDHLSGRSSREPDLALTGTARPAPEPASSAGGAPGISRFVAVDLKLAAGSLPSAAGLDWLTEKGYKTLVDLRESSETDLPFIGEATKRGLRYIVLPVNLKSIDRAHVARFNFELAMGEARPLYFFDSDGTRAGTLWYIRRVAVDRVNTEIARREAEDLGLNNPDYWSAARSYLERLDNPRSRTLDATGPLSAADPQKTAEPAPQPVRTTEPADSSTPTPAPAAPANLSKASSQAQAALSLPETASRPVSEPKAQEATDRDLGRSQTLTGPTALAPASSPAPSTTPPAPFDTTAWHPFAAIVITGLIFPLGYWSRTVFPTILARTLASLPAPARRLKSLPRELDA